MDNFLNAYGVWWLPGALLSAAAFIFAAVYGVCVVRRVERIGRARRSHGRIHLTGRLFVCTRAHCSQLLHIGAARRGGLRVRVLRHGPRQAAAFAAGGARSVRGGQGEDGEGIIRDGYQWRDGRRTRIGGDEWLQLRRQRRRSREGTGRKHRVRPRRRRCPLSLSETRVYEV